MKEHFITYLTNERLFSLAASLIGIASIMLAIYLLVFQPQLKSFALSLLILGALETGVFSVSYFRSDKRIFETLASLDKASAHEIEFQKAKTSKILTAFFLLKVFYVLLFVTATMVLSKFTVSDTIAGILLALILHAGFAATIDSIGERYTKKFQMHLNQNS